MFTLLFHPHKKSLASAKLLCKTVLLSLHYNLCKGGEQHEAPNIKSVLSSNQEWIHPRSLGKTIILNPSDDF